MDKASEASFKPPLADVDAKIHFSRGQCNFLRTYAGEDDSFEQAKADFLYVIQAYDNGKNPRLQELSAESYARLGLIYNIEGDISNAKDCYQKAVDLLPIALADRRALFQQRIEHLSSQLTPTP